MRARAPVFHQRYVYAAVATRRRARAIARPSRSGADGRRRRAALWVATVAAYFPLLRAWRGGALLARSWPAPIAVARPAGPRTARAGRASRGNSAAHADRGRCLARRAGAVRGQPLSALDHPGRHGICRHRRYLRELFPHAEFKALGKPAAWTFSSRAAAPASTRS